MITYILIYRTKKHPKESIISLEPLDIAYDKFMNWVSNKRDPRGHDKGRPQRPTEYGPEIVH